MSKKKLDMIAYEKGVADALKAVSKFCFAEAKTCEKAILSYAKKKQYAEAVEVRAEQSAYEFLGEGLHTGIIELDLPLLDNLE